MALIRPIPTKEIIKTLLPMSCDISMSSANSGVSAYGSLPPITDTMTFQFTSVHRASAAITQNSNTLQSIAADDSTAYTVNITDFEHPITVTITTTSTNASGTITATYNT